MKVGMLVAMPNHPNNSQADHHLYCVRNTVSAYTDAFRFLKGGPIMTANAPKIYDIAVEDVEYLRHGDTSLLARLFKPAVPTHRRTAWRRLEPRRPPTRHRPQRTTGAKRHRSGSLGFPHASRSALSRLIG